MGSIEFAELLRRLTAGDRPTSVQLTLLSDLGAAERAELERVWASIPGHVRGSLLERTIELAEDNVELDFSAVATIALRDEDPRVRKLAAEALWESRDRRVAQALVDTLAIERDATVRAAIATSLGTFVQLHALGQLHHDTGEQVVHALRMVAESAVESPDVRGRAIASLGALPKSWVDTLIRDASFADDRGLQLAAIAAMANSEDEKWLEDILPHLESDDPEFRYWGAYACGRVGSEEALPKVAALLDDPDLEVARAAIGALADIGGAEAARELSEFLARAPASLRPIVEEALELALADSQPFLAGLLP